MNEKATKQLIKTVKEATMRAKQQERRERKAVEAQEAIGRDAEAHANTIDIGKARTEDESIFEFFDQDETLPISTFERHRQTRGL